MIDQKDDALIRLAHDMRQVWRGDWTIAVAVLLYRRGRMRYRDLRDEMRNYSFVDPWLDRERSVGDSELSRTLGRMTQDGWVVRIEIPGQWHPLVSYELSESARVVADKVCAVRDWAAENPGFFALAQEQRRTPQGRRQVKKL